MIFKKIIYGFFFKKYWKIYKNSKLLKSNNNNQIEDLLYELTNYKISKKKSFLLSLIGISFLEISHRQYVIEKLITSNLFSFRLNFVKNFNSKKGIDAPLIIQHINFFESRGYKINKTKSLFKLSFIIFGELLKGLYLMWRTIFNFSSSFNNIENFAQFCDLPKDFEDVSIEKYNLFSWFQKYFNNKNYKYFLLNQKVNFLKLGKKINIKFTKEIFTPLNSGKKIIFFILSIIVFFYCLCQILNIKKWYKCLMFREYLLFIISKLHDKKNVASIYLFSQASYIYKPLWTYEIEKKGKEVVMYCFACSVNAYLKNGCYPSPEIGHSSMTWKQVLVWSDSFKKYNFSICKTPNYVLTSPIYYKDKMLDNNIQRPSLAIFDVIPYRDAIRASTYPNEDFRNSVNTIKFLKDIISISLKYGVNIYYKSGKDLNQKKYDKKYFKFIEKSSELKNFFVINYLVSPFQLIEKTNFSISLPFTSTGVIPKYFNKVGYYYDPTQLLSKNDRAIDSAVLISGYNELEIFFKENFI